MLFLRKPCLELDLVTIDVVDFLLKIKLVELGESILAMQKHDMVIDNSFDLGLPVLEHTEHGAVVKTDLLLEAMLSEAHLAKALALQLLVEFDLLPRLFVDGLERLDSQLTVETVGATLCVISLQEATGHRFEQLLENLYQQEEHCVLQNQEGNNDNDEG